MKRNGIGHMQSASMPSRMTTERTGKFVRGPRKGRVGKAGAGRVKRGR